MSSQADGQDSDPRLKVWEASPFVAFRDGVNAGFDRWETLQMAITQGWGGRNSQEKADQLVEDVVNMFSGETPPFQDEIEDVLLEACSVEFNCDVQDGSAEWIGRLCVTLFDDCMRKKDFSGLSRMVKRAPQLSQESRIEDSDDDADEKKEEEQGSDGEERALDTLGIEELRNLNLLSSVTEGAGDVDNSGDEAKPASTALAEPAVDEDGFQTVVRKGKRGKRGKKKR